MQCLEWKVFFFLLLQKKLSFLLRKESEQIIHIGGVTQIKMKAGGSPAPSNPPTGHCFRNKGATVAANRVSSLASRI